MPANFNPNDSSTGIRGLFATREKNGVATNIFNPRISAKREQQDMLAKDVATMKTDPSKLGKSQAEMDQAIGATQRAANAGANAQISSMNSAALAGQGFQQDAFQGAAQDIAKGATDATVQAASQQHRLNDAIISSEKNRIMGQLEAERGKQKDNAQFWGQMGISGVSAILSALGGPAGLAAGALGGGAPATAPAVDPLAL